MLVPVPEYITPSGLRVSVHDPAAGKPERMTLPVETLQEGCVTVPGTGAPGMAGPAITAIFAEGPEVQPPSFVTV